MEEHKIENQNNNYETISISKINSYEKNYNCSNEPNPNKPKKKYLYRSQKFYLNRFKIEKNFAKEKVEKVKE